ncbi:serine/threonine protein kinase [Microbacterium sp. Gd 4-13]|uniref:serine/threonine-protein kinase n=1 Tax=Microbacterium sp. Gd 4-13 TaxID=2173179 RepID=UPI000D56FDE0|nr:serine/threonine-protein kinase [Microbacterium sp. Gd 4-13]PVW05409.1 serine/threonine protein kinase [Microbacterium sp. Gd 4-13]
MSGRRAPQAPPELAGFTPVELLGSGGFADVFLYQQQLPRRRVAVKVLLPDRLATGSIDEFTAEANVMAMLSTHPAIVTIYQAGVAEDGRPYLVMEYCPKPNLQVRYRAELFSVAEALRIGVQVGAAVETAHRAGVLHRDIKPANILVTEYNRPALTDFGIASAAGAGDAGGLSIPWSPPEVVAEKPTSDARSDVWSLGATVYSLLVGRSPFELPGQRNSGVELITRIESAPLAPIGRSDVPPSLQRVLQRAMSKSPADRYPTALEFARALQKVQIELAHSVTPIDILDDGAPAGVVDDADDGLTRVRGVVSIDPAPAPVPAPSAPEQWAPDDATRRSRREAAAPPRSGDGDATVVRVAAIDPLPAGPSRFETVPPPSAAQTAAPAAPPLPPTSATAAASAPPVAARSKRGLWFALGAAAFVVVVGVILALSLPAVLGGPAAPTPEASPSDRPIDVVPVAPGAPEGLAGSAGPDGVTFTWTNPAAEDGDEYLWGVVARDGSEPVLERTAETSVTVAADPSGTTCIQVLTRRANGQASAPSTACTS